MKLYHNEEDGIPVSGILEEKLGVFVGQCKDFSDKSAQGIKKNNNKQC